MYSEATTFRPNFPFHGAGSDPLSVRQTTDKRHRCGHRAIAFVLANPHPLTAETKRERGAILPTHVQVIFVGKLLFRRLRIFHAHL